MSAAARTKVYATSPTALNLMDRGLIGLKAMEIGGDVEDALSSIPGVTADEDVEGGARFELGNVPSTAVNDGPIDISFDASSMTLDLAAGEAITVRGMLNTALKSEGIEVTSGKPAPLMKR